MKAHLQLENQFWKNNLLVAGIDEVGRGAFAGPLVATGVILKPDLSKKETSKLLSLGINDSKLISNNNREKITKNAQQFILHSVTQYISVDYINRFGVGAANKLAFVKVAKNLAEQVKNSGIFYLTDCFPIPEIKESVQENIVRGDQTSISIALASIIAKVTRDTYMENLSIEFPEYGFEKHKGYGTKLHRKKILEYGPSPHHRTKFIAGYV